ncbi:MAG: hypothetical protein J5I62_05355 [Flavobacteriales bacterium]|nr:hypothetical protein [Flavobacteriales bacterium]MEB2341529.1 hypothetical protein [Flavobacteriia bacterium]
MSRLVRRVLFIGITCLAGLLVLLAGLAWFFQDEVKAKLVAELNAHLTAPLHQQGIELTLIQRFPEASLRIRDAYMQEVRTDGRIPDTLLYAKDLYLEFSLFSLLRGEQTVRQLHGTGVVLRPGLDANGNGNWNVWRSDTTSTSTSGTDIDLRRVTFEGLEGRFRDDRTGLEVALSSDKLGLGGRFREQGSKLTAKGDLWLRHWRSGDETVLADRRAAVDLDMAFGAPGQGFRLEKGELLLGKTPLNLTLAVAPGKQGDRLDLRASGFGLDLASVVQLLPDRLRRTMKRYGMDGSADLALHYSGPLEGPGPALSIGMKLRDGRFTELNTGTAFRKVQGEFSADFTPVWAPEKLVVKHFTATSPSGPLSGNLELIGLRNAKLTADLRGDLALADLFRFIGLDTLEQVAGRMKAEAHVKGRLRDPGNITATDLGALTINGQVALRDASLKLKGLRHRITELNAELALKGKDALVHGLRFRLQGNAMELSGTLHNLMPYALFKDQRLWIEAKGTAPVIDLATLLETGPATGRNTASTYAFTLPAQIDMDLSADIGELRMEKFQATEIHGKLHINRQQLAMEPLRFRTAEGSVAGSLTLDARPAPAYPLAIRADLKGINVTALFAEFQDFGQSFITAKHVKGTGDARLLLTAPLRPDFSLDQPKLHCVADVTLANGELNGHASLIAVADHLRKNKLTSPFVDTDALRKQLQHVTFAKLENRIEIKDRKVHLPQMTVSSSVMDLEVSGTHGFDGEVDDHLNFRLGDLFRTGGGGQDEFGPIIDDGTGLRIFLHMYGTTDNLQFGNDGAMAAARRKERMKQETAQLKGILKGIVTGESTASAATPADPRERITLEPGDGRTQPAPPKPKPKKGLGRLLQKDEKDQPKVVIGVE